MSSRWKRFALTAWALALTVFLVIGALTLYCRLVRFEGLIPVEVGGTERLVVAAAGNHGPFASYRNMPLEVLPFSRPRAAASVLAQNLQWDARELPFPLRVQSVEVLRRFPDRHLLEIRSGKKHTRSLIFSGARVSLEDFTVSVVRVGPWAGLVRVPGGQPASAWSVRENPESPWKQGFFIVPDKLSRLGETLLRFRWTGSEDEALTLLPESLPVEAGARWGVRQHSGTQWIESLQPGTGLTLPDNREITLQGISNTPDRQLLFSISRPAGPGEPNGPVLNSCHVPPNGDPVEIGSGASLLAEVPALAPECVSTAAWRDNEVLVGVYRAGRRISLDRLTPGKTLALLNGWTLRFDQALRESAQAGSAEEPVLAAALALPDGNEITLREGLSVPAGKYYLRFYRETPAPEVVYTVSDATDRNSTGHRLGPGDKVVIRGWEFSLYPDSPDPERVAVFQARLTCGRTPVIWGLLLLLVAATLRAAIYLNTRRDASSEMHQSAPEFSDSEDQR